MVQRKCSVFISQKYLDQWMDAAFVRRKGKLIKEKKRIFNCFNYF